MLVAPLLLTLLPQAPRASAEHWAWRHPVRSLPAEATGDVERTDTARAIDLWLEHAARARGVAPNAPAPPDVLLRRLALDLTGLPPSRDLRERYRARAAGGDLAGAYEAAVEELLGDPAFGEHWAAWWLDLARYADTQGYEKDLTRNMWRWRDWVTDAFQDGVPFDRFTVEQLAGDLLPAASPDQVLATGFHRNTMTNDEGGTDDEEFRVAAVVDRVNTTCEVWLGLTMACAQCHEHKVDPFTQEDFYRLFAYFDQTADHDTADDAPTLVQTTAREAAYDQEVRARIQALAASIEADDPELDRQQAAWERDTRARLAACPPLSWRPWTAAPAQRHADFAAALAAVAGAPPDDLVRAAREGAPHPEWDGAQAHPLPEGEATVHVLRRVVRADVDDEGAEVVLSLGSDDGLAVWWNGARVAGHAEARALMAGSERAVVALRPGDNELVVAVVNDAGPSAFAFRALPLDLPGGILDLLARPEGAVAAREARLLRRWWRGQHSSLGVQVSERVEDLRARIPPARPPAPVLRELPPAARRTTHVLHRGSFLDPRAEVRPGVPEWLAAMPAEAGADRLALARWIVSPEHPLTARVLVNRVWARVFGTGIVETANDFGLGGAAPSHPELLDLLAVEWVAHGWDFRWLLRTLVRTEAYRRDARASAEALQRDPNNACLARAARYRLSAEVLRDQMLAASGLLSDRRYGFPVFPPQPAGLWRAVYNEDRWNDDTDENRYRRGLYTFWRRTMPYPVARTFDAPTRELCTSQRQRTNTPLQALVMLNDVTVLEASRALARTALGPQPDGAPDGAPDGGPDDRARLAALFERVVVRAPDPHELERLASYLDAERAARGARPADARAYAGLVADAPESDAQAVELAAWTAVAHLLWNLDEVLSRG